MASLPAFRELVALGPAWGRALVVVAQDLSISADELAATVWLESRGNPRAEHAGHVGLIQWGELAAADLHLTTAQILALDAMAQIELVRSTLYPKRARIRRPGDVRLAVFYPRALDWDDDQPFPASVRASNAGLDTNQDGTLTAGEVRGQAIKALAGRPRWDLGASSSSASSPPDAGLFLAGTAVLFALWRLL